MKVVATTAAFFGGRRVRPGQEVEVPEGTKGSWFVATDTIAAAEAKAPKAKKQDPKALSEIAKEQAQGPTDLA